MGEESTTPKTITNLNIAALMISLCH